MNDTLIGTYIGLWAGDGSRFYDHGYVSKIHLDKRNKLLQEFVQKVICKLFSVKAKVYLDGGNRACVKTFRKEIFCFVETYLYWGSNKTYTVHLRNKFSEDFRLGFLLGLMLSDGSLKQKLIFVSTSDLLTSDFYSILIELEFSPSLYVHKRAKYGWKDLNMVYISRKESKIVLTLLNEVLLRLDSDEGFMKIKNGPDEI